MYALGMTVFPMGGSADFAYLVTVGNLGIHQYHPKSHTKLSVAYLLPF